MNYQEPLAQADAQKKEYLAGIEYVIRALEEDVAATRDVYVKNLFVAPQKYREELAEMIGWPLDASRPEMPPEVTEETLFEDEQVVCSRLRIRLFGEFYASGLFFRQRAEGKHPLVVVQHGGVGSPELIAGFYDGGQTYNYNDLLSRVLARGAHVFAPLLLIWNKETHAIPYNRELLDARLRRVGSSLAALELFTVMRSLDYFEKMACVGALGMVGLSYGGFYALYTAALDTRIRATVAASHFFSRESVPMSDRSFGNGTMPLDDAAVAALVYPRSLTITFGKHDALFPYSAAEAEWERLKSYCAREKIHTDWINFLPFDGVHEFPTDDEALDVLFDELSTPTPKGRYES
ncbi:MAG: hypothetical protein IJV96_08010 [Clostridia bacterium]|nr:hypothetical protein [Clostridia bacterium]